MNITLSPELESLIDEKIKSGLYNSPNEVIREGLRLINEQEELKRIRKEELKKEVQTGINAMREGNFTTYDSPEELADDVINEVRREFEAKRENVKQI